MEIHQPSVGNGSQLTLETNGVLNGSQTLLNLVAGTNMTITDDGLGNITFDANGSGTSAAIIAATNSGDDQHYTLSQPLTTTVYYVIMNNLVYTTGDNSFPFSAAGSALTFNSPLPSDLASTQIFVVCI